MKYINASHAGVFFPFYVIFFFVKKTPKKQRKYKVDLHTISKDGFLSLNEINASWLCFYYQKKVRVAPVVLLIRQTMKIDQYFCFQLFVSTITWLAKKKRVTYLTSYVLTYIAFY